MLSGSVLQPTRAHACNYDLPPHTLPDILHRTASRVPERTAVVEGDHTLSFAELDTAARSVAAALADAGVRPGDRVLTQLPNWWETVVISWGVLLAGAVLVPVVPIYRAHELTFVIGELDPRAVIAPAEFRSYPHAGKLREVLDAKGSAAALFSVRGGVPGAASLDALLSGTVEGRPQGSNRSAGLAETSSEPGDIAVVLYTSGTTAQPKGVLHSHQTLLAEAMDVAGWCGLDGDDLVFMASPLSHITGLSYAVVMPVWLECGLVLQERWEPDAAVALIQRHGCTFTVSSTPFLRELTGSYARLPETRCALHSFVCGGADIPTDLVRSAIEVLAAAVLRTYGSTELPTSSMASPSSDLLTEADGEGKPMGRNEMVIQDCGDGPELLVRGPELFLGYVDERLNEAAFSADGFFRTGDQAQLDLDGTAHITGRIKDIINRGGEKFSVAEVEWVLLSHPDVADVAIVGFPDPILVERACAWVVPAAGKVPTVESLRECLIAAGLAVQKAPERVLLIDELPRTVSGKIQRFVLRQMVAERSPDQMRAGVST